MVPSKKTEYRNLAEKNEEFNQICQLDFASLSESEIISLLRLPVSLYLQNLGSNDLFMMNRIAEFSNKLVDIALDKKMYQDKECAHLITDIVCSVYDLSYMYEEEANVLKFLIDREQCDNSVKIRALERILIPGLEPEIEYELRDDIERYSLMFQQLVSRGRFEVTP